MADCEVAAEATGAESPAAPSAADAAFSGAGVAGNAACGDLTGALGGGISGRNVALAGGQFDLDVIAGRAVAVVEGDDAGRLADTLAIAPVVAQPASVNAGGAAVAFGAATGGASPASATIVEKLAAPEATASLRPSGDANSCGPLNSPGTLVAGGTPGPAATPVAGAMRAAGAPASSEVLAPLFPDSASANAPARPASGASIRVVAAAAVSGTMRISSP